MELRLEPKPVLAVCPNPAWQKTLRFRQCRAGEVNRAYLVQENGGGKGINLARVLHNFGFPVAVSGFLGGQTGQRLREELQRHGYQELLIECQAPTRCCYTIINDNRQQATELIEPSGQISPAEVVALQKRLQEASADFSAICLCGTLPPGVDGGFYAAIAACAQTLALPLLLDAFNDVTATLAVGVTLLKINAAELRQLSGEDDLLTGARALLTHYHIPWLGITAGADRAWLFSQEAIYSYTLPRLRNVVSAIGAGDCVTAILARRLAEEPRGTKMAEHFSEALACASASCLTDTPSLFALEVAAELQKQITCQTQPWL